MHTWELHKQTIVKGCDWRVKAETQKQLQALTHQASIVVLAAELLVRSKGQNKIQTKNYWARV